MPFLSMMRMPLVDSFRLQTCFLTRPKLCVEIGKSFLSRLFAWKRDYHFVASSLLLTYFAHRNAIL